MGRGFALTAMLGALALLASCADEDGSGQNPTATISSPSTTATPTSATPTSTPTPALDQYGCDAGPDGEKCRILATYTPEPTPTVAPPAAYHPTGTRTGVPEVDAIIAAIEARDARRLAELVNFLTYPCEEPRTVQPQPLRCAEGQEVGDPLVGIWAIHVEGGLWPPERDGDREALVPMFEQLLSERDLQLHAVYQLDGTEPGAEFLRPDFMVTFVWWHPQVGPWFDSFMVRDGGLIWIEFANRPISHVWDDADAPGWILAPAH